MANRVAVMHGVNLDALDRRPNAIYGDLSLERLESQVAGYAKELDLRATFFQTNHEGELVDQLHRTRDGADGLLLNLGAWTHYAWALRDALEIAALPAVEVHLSDVMAREDFRRVSVVRDLCVGTVAGKGVEGYREALGLLKAALA